MTFLQRLKWAFPPTHGLIGWGLTALGYVAFLTGHWWVAWGISCLTISYTYLTAYRDGYWAEQKWRRTGE